MICIVNVWTGSWIPTLMLIVSVSILVLGIVSYNSFIRNRLSQNQLDVVKEILVLIQKNPFRITFTTFNKTGSTGSVMRVTLFELKNILDRNRMFEKFEDHPVLFAGTCNQFIDFHEFISNPLTPRSIADQLLSFHSSDYDNYLPEDLAMGDFTIINSEVFIPHFLVTKQEEGRAGLHFQGDAFAAISWLNLRECSIALEKEIIDWLKSKGINDLNIRNEDFIHQFVGKKF